jgi:hypothetical protein
MLLLAEDARHFVLPADLSLLAHKRQEGTFGQAVDGRRE